ncbi:MAG: ion transporter [Lactobacillaceae bacterium]|jgi:voltage-gated sodium channel|nr:ion transporter [Lactobacillaceae bacterium]
MSRLYDFEKDREKVKKLVKSDNFSHLILFLILFDSIILGFMTSGFVRVTLGFELFLLDRLIVALFISEMLMKIYAFRGKFFKKGFNILDLIVVVISIIPATSYFVILRSLRLLRLIKYIDKDIKITQFFDSLISTIPTLMTALVSYGFILYIFGIMSVGFFGEYVEFSSLGSSVFTLIEVLMLDGVSTNIIKSIMFMHGWAWIFFLLYMMISYLIAVTFVIISVKVILKK